MVCLEGRTYLDLEFDDLFFDSEELENLNGENEQLKVEAESLKKDSRESRRKRDRVEKVLGEAATAIQMVLSVRLSFITDCEMTTPNIY